MQSRHSSSAHLNCDYVVDEEGIFLRRWIGLGAFFCWEWKVMVVVMNRGIMMEGVLAERGWVVVWMGGEVRRKGGGRKW